jgi:ABC-type methionine transport system ATPase subunit
MSLIEVKKLKKSFGPLEILKGIDLSVEQGERIAIIGSSGCGKSVFLRSLCLLEKPDAGQIVIDGQEITANGAKVDEIRRSMGMVFQKFHLFSEMDVMDNLCLAPTRLKGMSREEAEKKAMELLGMVGLSSRAHSWPTVLSGGQQQRIAIARALATEPKVLLCGEATSALDPKTTHDILSLLRELHSRLHITIILITHQMSVVEEICTRVAILDNGSVVEEGNVEEVFSAPKSAAAKRLVFPDGYEELPAAEGEKRRIRVVFRGASTATQPLIARMAMEQHIMANILDASIKTISEKEYGSMVLEVGSADEMRRALTYFAGEPEIIAEEVKPNAAPVA